MPPKRGESGGTAVRPLKRARQAPAAAITIESQQLGDLTPAGPAGSQLADIEDANFSSVEVDQVRTPIEAGSGLAPCLRGACGFSC